MFLGTVDAFTVAYLAAPGTININIGQKILYNTALLDLHDGYNFATGISVIQNPYSGVELNP